MYFLNLFICLIKYLISTKKDCILNISSTALFHAICFLAAIILVGRCIYLYYKDGDVSQVEYHNFHDSKDHIYPSVSICIKNPIFIPFWSDIFGNAKMEVTPNLKNKCWRNFYRVDKPLCPKYGQQGCPWMSTRAGKIRMNYMNLLEGKTFHKECFETTKISSKTISK